MLQLIARRAAFAAGFTWEMLRWTWPALSFLFLGAASLYLVYFIAWRL